MIENAFVRRSVLSAVVLFSGIASAQQSTAGVPTRAPAPVVLQCPVGAKQVGGFNSKFEATLCMRSDTQDFHGPYVQQWANGTMRVQGQFLNGFRSGHWTFFYEDGTKEAEIDFTTGNYDGKRVLFHTNGRIKLEENWVKGMRQGIVREFDSMGDVVAIKEFRNDREVVAVR